MLSFAPTITEESRAVPGAKITVRRLTKIQRSEMDLDLIEHTLRNTELAEQMKDLQKPYPWPKDDKGEDVVGQKPPAMPMAEWIRYLRMDHEMGGIINARVKPATVRKAFVSIEGLDYAGQKPTAELLLASGPDELIDEVYLLAVANMGLSFEQAKNWRSPFTSDAPEKGESSSSASDASGTPSTEANAATAAGTSPTK